MDGKTLNKLIEKNYVRGPKKQKNITLPESTIALIDNLSETLSINRNEIVNVAILEFLKQSEQETNKVIQPAVLELPENTAPTVKLVDSIEYLDNGKVKITEKGITYIQNSEEQRLKEQTELFGAAIARDHSNQERTNLHKPKNPFTIEPLKEIVPIMKSNADKFAPIPMTKEEEDLENAEIQRLKILEEEAKANGYMEEY